jgi:osmotically inducible protein OsmC
MANRYAHARWEGTLGKGTGRLKTESGALDAGYSYGTRFEDEKGTNPEELIGAAHAGCFSMALSMLLDQAGHPPNEIETKAQVTLGKKGDHFEITCIELSTNADVPGIDTPTFEKKAEEAKEGCPVSRALAGTDIHLDARLRSR